MNDPFSILRQKHNMNEWSIEQYEKKEDEQEKEIIQQGAEKEVNKIKEEPDFKTFFSDENGNGCPICLLPLCNLELSENEYIGYHITNTVENSPVEIPNCKHVFHKDCLRNYCGKTIGNTLFNCKCPICRREFSNYSCINKASFCRRFSDRMNGIVRKYKKIYLESQGAKRMDRQIKKQIRERDFEEKRRKILEDMRKDTERKKQENAIREREKVLLSMREPFVKSRETISSSSVLGNTASYIPPDFQPQSKQPIKKSYSEFEREFTTGFSSYIPPEHKSTQKYEKTNNKTGSLLGGKKNKKNTNKKRRKSKRRKSKKGF